jgi:hypothetical protein
MLVVCMPCFALLQRPGSLVVKAAFSAGGAVMNGIYLKVLLLNACMSCACLVLLCFTSLALWLSRLPSVLERLIRNGSYLKVLILNACIMGNGHGYLNGAT